MLSRRRRAAAAAPTPYRLDYPAGVAFGYDVVAANAPDYLQLDYTYTAAATGGAAIALPLDPLGAGAVQVSAGVKVFADLEFLSLPGADFALVSLIALPVNGGAPSGSPASLGLDRFGGVAQVGGSPFTDQNTVASLTGYRVGLLCDGDSGLIFGTCSDGGLVEVGAITPGHSVLIYPYISDEGDTAAGQTISVRLGRYVLGNS